MKQYLKSFVPQQVRQWLNMKRIVLEMKHLDSYNNNRTVRFSSTFNSGRNAKLAQLLIEGHTLEKGITMPNRRLGFGQDLVRNLLMHCRAAINEWGRTEIVEIQSVLANLKQYLDIHEERQYELPEDIQKGIKALTANKVLNNGFCYPMTKEELFRTTEDFAEFAHSRHSIRCFSDKPVDDELLMKAIQLAQTSPSACNRQATRVKIIASDEGKKLCCSLQRGNRGFGDNADRWLLITTELGDWAYNHIQEGFTDAGIFVMNLLYSLHYYNIAACTLNALFSPEERENLRKGLGYPDSEEPVCFIVIGNPTEEFMVPRSARLSMDDIVQKI